MTRGSATRPPDSIDASATMLGGQDDDVPVEDGVLPDAIGRFQPLEILGTGAMGMVFSAYDPKLDRRVAIKVVRRQRGGEAAQTRLLREAQALAKLSHENVVQVYDVGTLGEAVYIAMEFVDGSDLRKWLTTPRPPLEVLATFRRAGAGLAAAHDVGLIHRDFKPANVLLGTDGRVKVADFGLVRPSDATAPPAEDMQAIDVETSPSEAFSVGLTRNGAMLGTPAYMAPEQFQQLTVTARSDQFAFAAALWEGLFGTLPHPQKNLADLATAVIDGARAPMPASPSLTPRGRAAIARALHVDPACRFDDMHDLLEALAPETPRRRTWWVAAAIGLAVLGIAAAEVSRTRSVAGMCEGGADRIGEIYSGARKRRIEAQFRESGLGFADDTWSRLEARVDVYADGWASGYDDACRATHVQHEQSEASLDLRMNCLREALAELDGLLTALETAGPETVEQALGAADELTDLGRCEDTAKLAGHVPLPADPALRRRIESADALLQRAEAHHRLGDFVRGLATTVVAAATLREVSHPPTRTRMERQLATGFARVGRIEEARRHGQTAFNLALRHQLSDELVKNSIVMLGVNDDTRAHAETWASIGDGAAELAGRETPLEARRLLAVAELRADIGDHESARTMIDEALRLARAHGTASDQADAMWYDAMLSARTAEHERGLATATALQALVSQHFGPRHPQSAAAEQTLAEVLGAMHRFDESRGHYNEALEILKENFGSGHQRVLAVTESIAVSLDESGRTEEARPYFAEQVRRLEEDKASSRRLASALNSLCFVEYKLGDHDGAMTSCQRARDMFGATAGPESPGYAVVLSNIGLILRAQDRPDEALAVDRQALAIYEEVFGPDHLMTSYGLLGIAQAHVAAGRPHQALEPGERLLRLREGLSPIDPGLVAEARVVLGQALWQSDRPRAEDLLTQAGDTFATSGPAWQRALHELQSWKREHPSTPDRRDPDPR